MPLEGTITLVTIAGAIPGSTTKSTSLSVRMGMAGSKYSLLGEMYKHSRDREIDCIDSHSINWTEWDDGIRRK